MRPMNPQVWIETLILLFMSASCIVFGLRAIMAGFRLGNEAFKKTYFFVNMER